MAETIILTASGQLMSVLLTLIKDQIECVYHVSSYVCGHFVSNYIDIQIQCTYLHTIRCYTAKIAKSLYVCIYKHVALSTNY